MAAAEPEGKAAAAVNFDYVVVTASTTRQRDQYKALVQRRIDAALYPAELKFFICNDPETGRVGSGGGTLLALAELLRSEDPQGNSEELTAARAAEFFARRKVLVLHAGGESRRLPCYVPEGKLFAPLAMPRRVCDAACPPVVLDILLQLYCKYPWKEGEVILASGDVIVDFDVADFVAAEAQGLFRRGDICGFGKGTSFQQGSRHGCFAFENEAAEPGVPTLPVRDFHQKSPPDVLQRECAVATDPNMCAVDTGIFSLGPRWVRALFDFACAPLPAATAESLGGEGDGPSPRTLLRAVEASELYFDFYLECVTASLPQQPLAAYLERMRASGTKMGMAELELMHDCLSPLDLRGALVSGAAFLHFGSLVEYPESSQVALSRGMWPLYIGEAAAAAAVGGEPGSQEEEPLGMCTINCGSGADRVQVRRVASAGTSKAELPWVESCSRSSLWLHEGGFNMVVGVDDLHLSSEAPLPDGICLDGRHWSDEKGRALSCTAVYGSKDTFKRQEAEEKVLFCGLPLVHWLEARGLGPEDVWDSPPGLDLWNARLFCQCSEEPPGGLAARLRGYWDAEAFDRAWFLSSARLSLQALNGLDSALVRDARRITFRSALGV